MHGLAKDVLVPLPIREIGWYSPPLGVGWEPGLTRCWIKDGAGEEGIFILRCFSLHILLYYFSRKKGSGSPWISSFTIALFALISFNVIDEHGCLKTNKYWTEARRKRGKVWQSYGHIAGL